MEWPTKKEIIEIRLYLKNTPNKDYYKVGIVTCRISAKFLPMKKAILQLGLGVLGVTGAPSIVRRLAPNQGACAVMYHGLTDAPSAGMTNFTRLHLDAGVFRQQARLFARSYRVLPLEEVAEAIRNGERLPPNCVVLTFDDGYESNYRLAFPILREFGLHATVFVTTGFVEKEFYQWPDRLEYALGATRESRLLLEFENLPPELPVNSLRQRRAAHRRLDEALKRVPQERQLEAIAQIEDRLGAALAELDPDDVPPLYRPLSWEQIREMAATEHVTIGAHTHTHPILSRVSEAYARRDMTRCLELLAEKGRYSKPGPSRIRTANRGTIIPGPARCWRIWAFAPR